MKYRIVLFGFFLFGILYIFLQKNYAYHFFYIEQESLFLFSWPYFQETVMQPGGPAIYIGEFLTQFFILPYAGSTITAILLATTGVITALICQRIAPQIPLYLLYILPVIVLLLLHTNANYLIYGTVSYLFVLIFLYLYTRISYFPQRLAWGLFAVPLLFWLGGPIISLFVICILLWELLNLTPHGYWVLLVAFVAIFVGIGSIRLSVSGDYHAVFLPDSFYRKGLTTDKVIYFSWMRLPIIIVVTFLFRKMKKLTVKKEILVSFVQILLIAWICRTDISKYEDRRFMRTEQLDYFSRTQQWDQVIKSCKTSMDDYVHLAYLNMALAEKKVLADSMFTFDQHGILGLYTPNYTSILLCDIYFALGYISLSQEMAFESYLLSAGSGNPRMLQRLIQTNLIYGTWPVAEKYLDILGQTFYYKNWAKEYRRFLYNDAAVERDPLLGAKRKSLSTDTRLRASLDVENDLPALAEHYPENHAPIEYLGATYLLSREQDAFKKLLENYYGTEVLPSLPVSFQEAVLLFEKDIQVWEQYHISSSLIQRFETFKKLSVNQNNAPASALRSFADTYWFYYMFKAK